MRQVAVSEATFDIGKKKYPHLGVSAASCTLEDDPRLKRLVADPSLDKQIHLGIFDYVVILGYHSQRDPLAGRTAGERPPRSATPRCAASGRSSQNSRRSTRWLLASVTSERIVMTLQEVTPMIHVRDVRATVAWYESIGFAVLDTNEDGEEGMNFAILSYGNSQIMLNAGGRLTSEGRRDIDLYVRTDDVAALHDRLKNHVQVCAGLRETLYGTREFIVRDPNGFWLTFGQDLCRGRE